MHATADYDRRCVGLDRRSLARWAAHCAKHILRHFQAERPDDPRPAQALAEVRRWARSTRLKITAARTAAVAAHAAARAAKQPAAVAAARAAGHAAGTAHSARHARGTAIYALLTAALNADPTQRDAAIRSERRWQLACLQRIKKSGAFRVTRAGSFLNRK